MITPHGGQLVQQIITDKEERKYLIGKAKEFVSLTINDEQVKEVKNIARGLYSPLKGYMNKDDYLSVTENLRLASGIIWPIPIALDVPDSLAKRIHIGRRLALYNKKKELIAIVLVNDTYTVKKKKIIKEVFKTLSMKHPGVLEMMKMHDTLIGGEILLIDNSKKTYNRYNLDPVETRILFREKGWKRIIGFQTRNAPHRAHEYLQKTTLEIADGLFINPVMGKKKKGDFTDKAIITSYNTLIEKFMPKERVVFSILPLRMRYAGPREAVMHALIRKNFGCSHFVVGRDHAGVGDFYGPYDAQKLLDSLQELDIKIIKLGEAFYCEICNNMATAKTCPHDEKYLVKPSGTLIREKIRSKEQLPEEMIRPEILESLQSLKNVFVE